MLEATFVKPVIISFFGFNLYSYGLMVALALGSCTCVMSRELRRLTMDADASTFMLAFLPGFWLGSKAQMAVSAFATGGPMPTLGIEAGHSFMGSAVGGAITAAAYGQWCGLKPLWMLDIIAPLIPLGHSIGKWGCFLSGDGCYGPKASPDLPWAMSFPNGGVPEPHPVHPTPLYESALSAILFTFLHFGVPIPSPEEGRTLPVGKRAALTLSLYGIERMMIEPWRRHPPSEYLWGLTEYQFLAAVFIMLGALVMVIGRWMEPWGCEHKKKVEKKKNK